MKSYLDEAKQDPRFIGFLERLMGCANYFVAKETGDEHAIQLCIAQTWIESRSPFIIKLNPVDFENFEKNLDNPPPPNEKLIEALKRGKK